VAGKRLTARQQAMEFRVLGSLAVLDGGETVSLGGGRQQALLAILLRNANRVVSSEQLVSGL
jgi:DNA-binding SARP family transcriptional activator